MKGFGLPGSALAALLAISLVGAAAAAGNTARSRLAEARALAAKWQPDAVLVTVSALQAKDDDPEIHCLLGEAFARKGQNEAAAKGFERCLMLRPDHPDAAKLRERIQQLRKRRTNLPGA